MATGAEDAVWAIAEGAGTSPLALDKMPAPIIQAACRWLNTGEPCWKCHRHVLGLSLVVWAGYAGRWHLSCWHPPLTCVRCGQRPNGGRAWWGTDGRVSVLGALCDDCGEVVA